jgi:NTE family protein
MKLCRVAVCVLLLSNLWAQENSGAIPQQQGKADAVPQPPDITMHAKQRPRIGLVLEGGGALGLAHAGVIQWLEENRIPVDMIAGTSMGGLIGGLYATGKTPDEIRTLIKDTKWNKVLGGSTPYRDLSFRRKEDRREYQNAFEFGLKEGTQFPSGFNSGQQVGLILDRVGLPYSEMKSFDDLPIPFRCVATDLVSGKAYPYDHGSLAEAMRATMSLPAFFVPVRDGSHVLVDGGLLDNLPVDLARKMGAQIVIAVHLKTAPLDPKKSLSSVGVLERSASVSIAVNEQASIDALEKADIVLTVHVEKFDTTDYTKFEKIEEEGYKAAQERGALLSQLQVDEKEWKQIRAARAAKRRQVSVPEFVEVRGATGDVLAGLQHDLDSLTGKTVNPRELDDKMMRITGLGRFALAGYREETRDGQHGLLVEAQEKEYAPPTVHPLLVIDGSDYKNVLFQVGGRVTFLDVGGFGSEWRNDFVAGSEYGVKTEFFHPFNSHTGWFAAAHGTADSSPFNVYLRDRILAEYRDRRTGGGLDVGYTFGRNAEMRIGYEAGYQKISEEIGVPVAPAVHGRYGMTSAEFRFDHFDDPVIPRSGARLESAFHFYDTKPGTSDVVPSAETRLGLAARLCKEKPDEPQSGLASRTCERTSVLLFASGGTSFSTHDTGFPLFSLGGPLRLGAYGTNELLTNQYFLVQPTVLYKLRELSPLLKQNMYLLSMYEAGKAYGPSASTTAVAQDATVGVLFQTVFGPMFFGGSLGDADHRRFFFKVGRFF